MLAQIIWNSRYRTGLARHSALDKKTTVKSGISCFYSSFIDEIVIPLQH
ncbi:MAG: hypothetical protein LBQ64_04055 [Bacteroidales bacterium]|nr:hypothetical protein [Bacteroidales bacterium]